MKKILLLISLIIIYFGGFSQTTSTPYPIKQNLGNAPTTEVMSNNIYSKFIVYSYPDTTTANLDAYVKYQPFCLIATTSPIALWFRDYTNTIWIQLLPSGGSGGQRAWLDGGNTNLLVDGSNNATFGSLGSAIGINFKTNSTTRLLLGGNGILDNSAVTVKQLGYDTVTKRIVATGAVTAGWSLTGNAGTNPTTNFLGTTDGQPLKFRVNNSRVGYIGVSDGNLSFGNSALIAITTGVSNNIFGPLAGQTISSGDNNTGIGSTNLAALSTGSNNTANGYNSLTSATTTSNSIGIGAYAGAHSNIANRLYLNSIDRSNENGDSTLSLVYGVMATTLANQRLKINGKFQVNDASQSNGYIFQSDANGIGTWVNPSSIVTSPPINTLIAATGTNSINNGNLGQTWAWNTLSGFGGLNLSSSSTAAASNSQVLFSSILSGANSNSGQATAAGYFSNTHTGTTSTNEGIFASATGGTTNSAIIIPTDGGNLLVGGTPSVNDSTLTVERGMWAKRGVRFSTLPTSVTTSDFLLNVTSTGIISRIDPASIAGITGTGTTNNIIKWTGSTVIGNSLTTDDGNVVTLASPVTTGNGYSETTSTLTTGNLMKLTSTSTVVNNGSLLNIVSSGANSTASKTANGGTISITNTGTTSNNIGLSIITSGAYTDTSLIAEASSVLDGNAFGIYGAATSVDGLAVGGYFEGSSTGSGTSLAIYAKGNIQMGDIDNGYGIFWANPDWQLLTSNTSLLSDNANSKIQATGAIQFASYTAGAATFDGSGNITSVSDRRAKHNIKPFTYGLDAITKLRTSSFIYNQDKSNTLMSGFIAQDVQKVIPIAVHQPKEKDGMLSLETNAILAAAVNAIRELKKLNDIQQKEIDLLKKQLLPKPVKKKK